MGQFDNYDQSIKAVEKLFIARKYVDALKRLDKLRSKYPSTDEILNFKAIILLELNQLNQSLKCLDDALTLNHTNPITFLNIGNVYQKKGELGKSIDYYMQSIRLHMDTNTLLNLSSAYYLNAQYRNSIEVLDKIHLTHQDIERVHQLFASNYRELHRFAEHKKHLEIAIKINPTNFENFFHLAFYYQSIGDFKTSKELYEKAIQLNPSHGQSFYNLYRLEGFSVSIKEVLSKYKKNTLDIESQAHINFLLAEISLKDHNYHEYKKYLRQANTQLSNKYPFDLNKEQLLFNKVIKTWGGINNHWASSIKIDDQSFSPIFILGLPRSGSSLVEQMITNNNEIYGCGEVSKLYADITQFFENYNASDNPTLQLQVIADDYIEHIRGITKDKIFTDKLPLNYKYMGIIKFIFPSCKFILTVRNSFDNLYSLYRNFFLGSNLNFCYDEGSLNNMYRLYEDYIRYWKSQNVSMYIHDHDEFLIDKINSTKNLFEYLNLDFNSQILDIKNNERPILTASNTQLRSEIFSQSKRQEQNMKDIFPKLNKVSCN